MLLQLVGRIGRRGSGSGEFLRPTYAAALPDGGLLVADELQNCIVELTPLGEPRRTIRSGGAHEEMQFCYPTGVATDGEYLFIADSLNYRIQKLRLSDLECAGCAGSKGSGDDQLKGPQGLALHGEQLFVADYWSHRVLVYSTELVFQYAFGREGAGPDELNKPTGIAADDGDLFVADSGNGRVQVFTTRGEHLRSIGGESTAAGRFDNPRGLVVADGWLIVAEFTGKRLHLLTRDGEHVLALAPSGGGGLCGLCAARETRDEHDPVTRA